jgi:hypothetical protein
MSTTISNAFISVNDIVNNFIISYTGPGKIIPDSKRTEVIFHARRCLQEFAYETLKSKMTDNAGVIPTPPATYPFPTDLVAIIKVSAGAPLVEFTQLTPTTPPTLPAAGQYLVDYAAKTILFNAADAGKALSIEYLSNALTTDESAAIPKLAEEAMYACMVYAILANRENSNPNTLQRLLIEKTDKLEKAKSRLVFTNFS